MTYQATDSQGNTIDAHFDINGCCIVFHSRSGGKLNARNEKYGEGLRILISRLRDAGLGIRSVAVDSSAVQNIPIRQRLILEAKTSLDDVDEIYSEIIRRMRNVRSPTAKGEAGGALKRIRIETTAADAEALCLVLKGVPASRDTRSQHRLPAELLNKVGEQYIYNAVQILLSGSDKHPFGESTDFDILLENGTRLPPKAVFGIAAKEALGMEVLPKHFSGGDGTVCFRIIEACGYTIVPKGTSEPAKSALYPPDVTSDDDREFVEGKPKRIEHLKRERHQGAAKAKKAAFKAKFGILFCERCNMKPIEVYGGEVGEACIEVHHTKPIADMKEGDTTKLEDLQCLCASCHRVVHRELRIADR